MQRYVNSALFCELNSRSGALFWGHINVFIGQPAIVGAHGIVRPVNIPLNDAETQKMQASARELQEIIDEAWKNPEFQAASKN